MRIGKSVWRFLAVLLISTKIATAGDLPVIKLPISFSGNTCGIGNTNIALSPDGQVLSVMFDAFKAEVGNEITTNTKDCNIIIPIEVPDRSRLEILKADYRGFNYLPKGSKVEFFTHYEFYNVPSKESKRIQIYKGPMTEEFLDSNVVHANSPCGGLVYLKISMKLTVHTNQRQEVAFSELDTADITQPRKKKDRVMKYKMSLDRCSQGHFGR
jgi:hypothetical protein